MTRDAPESNSRRFFRVVNSFPLSPSLSKAVLENKKRAAELPRLPPKKAPKKGRVSLYRTLCREKKVRLSLYQVELFSGFIKRPAIVKRSDFPYIKVSFFVVLVNPR